MKRRNFIRLISSGGMMLFVSPLVSAAGLTPTNGYSCGLFYKGKELDYEGYKRIETYKDELFRIEGDKISIDLPPMSFPQTPKVKIDPKKHLFDQGVRADEVRIYRKTDNLLVLYSKIDASVIHGVITVIWR